MHLAENSMFIVLAKLLWAFDIRPPVDAAGNEMKVDLSDDAFKPGANTIPKSFRAAKRDGSVLRGVKVREGGVET